MGKKDKKQRNHHKQRGTSSSYYNTPQLEGDEQEYFDDYPQNLPLSDQEQESDEELEVNEPQSSKQIPSKFLLYQQSVQSPKGDISYLQKFFLTYVGGRLPLHLQEDFCGTALLSAEWLRTDSRRTAVGVDLDLEAINWCLENNMNKIGADVYSRISLFHRNVLRSMEAKLVKSKPLELIHNIRLDECKDDPNSNSSESSLQVSSASSADDKIIRKDFRLPARDIVCAFNYSCCCLHKRAELVTYFSHVLDALSKKGGVFVMDLYGGTSSECKLKLSKNFQILRTYGSKLNSTLLGARRKLVSTIISRSSRKKIRLAFSYSWRLWSLPEIKDCLEEAGFRSIHFWLRQMPDTEENKTTKGFGSGQDIKYEEVKNFEQQDSWNAYIVAVA